MIDLILITLLHKRVFCSLYTYKVYYSYWEKELKQTIRRRSAYDDDWQITHLCNFLYSSGNITRVTKGNLHHKLERYSRSALWLTSQSSEYKRGVLAKGGVIPFFFCLEHWIIKSSLRPLGYLLETKNKKKII